MRAFSAIAAALLVAGTMLPPARADAPGPTAAPGCHCPGVRHVRHVRRHVHVWYRAYRNVEVAAIPAYPLPPYNPPLPPEWDTAYDRAMTLHLRSPAVSGIFVAEPGFPPTPPILGDRPYRGVAGPAVLQYDELTGRYIQLAQPDAQRVLAWGWR